MEIHFGAKLDHGGSDEDFQKEAFGDTRVGSPLLVSEISKELKAAIKEAGVQLREKDIHVIHEDGSGRFEVKFGGSLVTPIWQGGCVALVGGLAQAAAWGNRRALLIVACEGVTKNDIEAVVGEVSKVISGNEGSATVLNEGLDGEKSWGVYHKSEDLCTVDTTPVWIQEFRATSKAFTITALPAQGSGKGTELLRVRVA